MKCSKLKIDLFSLDVVDSLECICENDVEDCEQHLFECPLYFVQRKEMMRKLNNLNTEDIEI